MLAYPELNVPIPEAEAFAAIVAATAQPDGLVRTKRRLSVLRRDPSDNVVLETALLGRADYLVAGNRRHFAELGPPEAPLMFHHIRIVTPREFLEAREMRR